MASDPYKRIKVSNQIGHDAANVIFDAIDEVAAGVLSTTDITATGDLTVGDDATVTGVFRAKDKFIVTPTDADVTEFGDLVVIFFNGEITSTSDGISGLYQDLDLHFETTGPNGVNGVIIDNFGGVTADETQLGTIAGVSCKAPLIVLTNGAAVTNAATLWVRDAPTAATNNYGLWVQAGDTRLGGALISTPPANQTLTNDNTITLPAGVNKIVDNAGNVTGIIMTAGTKDGQIVNVINAGTGSVTFATAATSNVADGTSAVIATLRAVTLIWDSGAARWFRTG